MQSKFADIDSVKGKKKEDIIAEVGQPNSISATPGGGQILQWMATGYHIVLEFDANGICQGVTYESAVGAHLSPSSTMGSITKGPMA